MIHASLLWSSASSGPTISSHSRVNLLCSACGQNAPGISFLEPVCEGHGLSSRFPLVEIGGFRQSSAAGESPVKAISRWWFHLAFLFVFFCLYFYSQFDFVVLKCYWNFCWHSNSISHLFICLWVSFNVKRGLNGVHIMFVCCLDSCFKSKSFLVLCLGSLFRKSFWLL